MQYANEPMLDMFIYETTQLIEQLETSILSSEKTSCYTQSAINEIFRIMHTIKGSAAMMMFDGISRLAHSVEDLFYFLREEKPEHVDCSALSDLVLDSVDFLKVEIEKIKNGDEPNSDISALIDLNKAFLCNLKRDNPGSAPTGNIADKVDKQQYYISSEREGTSALKNSFKAVIFFESGCEMENIRAFSVIHQLKGITDELAYLPEDILDNDTSVEVIRKEGFTVYLRAELSYENLHELLMRTLFIRDLELVKLENDSEINQVISTKKPLQDKNPEAQAVYTQSRKEGEPGFKEMQGVSAQQSLISVNVVKLDKLMDLVGEMVIAEAMVVQNPDLYGLELDNFQKSARQLNKITDEIQDMVMSIRMVPLSATFHKMHRIVRDMCKRLNKEVGLDIFGEQTEVDKNIIEHISDPLMHLVRNAIDHGIETHQERMEKGKSTAGTITLEAENSGSDVLIRIKDDGKGLSREKILKKARESGLLHKPEEELSDKEIYNLVFLPGFSTKDDVSEYSGRGVGMDVVTKNIEAVGGSVSVDSIPGSGTIITLKIPLTLAIIDGMNIKVGSSCYTIPTISIKESFRVNGEDIITDPDGREMIMVRGKCYPVLRLYEIYKVKNSATEFHNGIIIMVEQEGEALCLFADELLGQQQVVVKSLPNYIRSFRQISGLAGCTLLGDGSISLILDITGLMNKNWKIKG